MAYLCKQVIGQGRTGNLHFFVNSVEFINSAIKKAGLDLDIFDKNGYHIIIENKIYAGDQDKQLIRYDNYGKTRCNKYKLFYLTLNGDMPDEDKSCKSNGHEISPDKDYYLLAYSTDIINWLERCREKAAVKPLLREGISHYINLIKYLTNQKSISSLPKNS